MPVEWNDPTAGWTDTQGNWHRFCNVLPRTPPPDARLWAMVQTDSRGRVIMRTVCNDRARSQLLLDASWRTDYEVTNAGESVTCEHGHPNCGIGSTLCGDEHQ